MRYTTAVLNGLNSFDHNASSPFYSFALTFDINWLGVDVRVIAQSVLSANDTLLFNDALRSGIFSRIASRCLGNFLYTVDFTRAHSKGHGQIMPYSKAVSLSI